MNGPKVTLSEGAIIEYQPSKLLLSCDGWSVQGCVDIVDDQFLK